MDGLGLAASIIAVLDLSAKVASLCFQYSKAVRNAPSDIKRLCEELDRLNTTLEGAQQLLQGPNGAQLQTSQRQRDGLNGCSFQLVQLQTKLEKKLKIGATRIQVMSGFGVYALKWPFESKNVDDIIMTLARYRDALSTALTIDQTAQILDISQTLSLSRLLIAKDAAFDSHADEHDERCHLQTRVALRQEIIRWAEDPQGECIFWLNGMAGTGKSTMSRTIAESFNTRGNLGASFFFKRGERDRGNAARLFTTIAAGLVTKEPALAVYVQAAIDTDPAVTGKALKEQFEKLVLQPLGKLQGVPDKIIVLVIDALDECERDDDIRAIIYLLSQAKTLTSVRLRTFLTSRPELPIRLGFKYVEGEYRDIVLHEVPKPIIKHDITVFLNHRLAKVREDYNALLQGERQLPLDWPSSHTIQDLVQMAVPLFIFAATICRFIEDPAWADPAGQLAKVLEYRSRTQQSEISKLDATYRPILDQLLTGTEVAKRSLANEVRIVVGSIVLLAEPLSTSSLARLLDIPKSVIDRRLMSLHSILSVPASAESPVRMFHLSFRDFLTDPDKRNSNPFWVDERATHERIATRCLVLLSGSGHLRKDICNLEMSGVTRMDVNPAIVESHLPADVRYACLYWVHHSEKSNTRIADTHQAYLFLKRHFLHWLEALSLLGKISDSITMVKSLQALISPSTGNRISAFLQDANRFILSYRSIIDLYPLQLYSSAIIFTPKNSIIRNIFKDHIPGWISLLPKVNPDWDACLQALESYGGIDSTVTFSPDGTMLASASPSGTIQLWDAKTGEEKHELEGRFNAIAFSPDGAMLALASHDGTVRLWDAKTGEEKQKFEGHSESVTATIFSPNGTMLASASEDRTIRLWDAKTGKEKQKLEGQGRWVGAIAFSPDGMILASTSDNEIIQLWDMKTGEEKQKLKGHGEWVRDVAFSPDGTMLASASNDQTVRLWDVRTGKEKQTLNGHGHWVNAITFSPDNMMLASASSDRTIWFWDMKTGEGKQKLEDHRSSVEDVTFSPDGTMLASASGSGTIRLWDVEMGKKKQEPKGYGGPVWAVTFSPDGTMLISASEDGTIWLWDVKTGEEKQKLEGSWFSAVTFSPDSTMLASASRDGTIRLWDARMGERQKFEVHGSQFRAVTFSPEGTILALASDDGIIQLWDAKTGEEKQKFGGHSDSVMAITFSPDGTTLASVSDNGTIRLWDAKTGKEKQKFVGRLAGNVAFSPDSTMLALPQDYGTIWLWDVKTGEEKQKLKSPSEWVSAIAFSSDGTMLASTSNHRTIRLWDTKTGEEKKTLQFAEELTSILFSTDNQHLKTNRGQLNLCLNSTDMSLHNDCRTMQLFLNNDWVVRDGRKVLWLPSDVEPWSSAFYDNTFALGDSSGFVKFIKFTFT